MSIQLGLDLFIFDFDDTLAISDSLVKVIRSSGEEISMTSREFAHFPLKPTDTVNFDDFQRAEGTLIMDTVKEMQRAMDDVGDHVYIVTARSIAGPVEEFLKQEIGNHPPVIATAGSAGKKPWLLQQLTKEEYTRVVVYEDCKNNIRMLKDAVKEHNALNNDDVIYSAMCILEDQSVIQAESRWRSENLLTEWDFRETVKKFLRKVR